MPTPLAAMTRFTVKTWATSVVVTAGLSAAMLAVGFGLGVQQRGAPPLPPIFASTSAASATMAVATGRISEDAEGIFFLDFLTGDLQCLVYYPRAGVFGARYFTNVLGHLPGGGKNTQYLMVTGAAISKGSTGGARPGESIVYITDTNAGMFAAFTVPWDRTAESGGRVQSGPLVYVGGGPIRNYQLRDPALAQPAVVEPKKKP